VWGSEFTGSIHSKQEQLWLIVIRWF
jgi:hypothetical protein